MERTFGQYPKKIQNMKTKNMEENRSNSPNCKLGMKRSKMYSDTINIKFKQDVSEMQIKQMVILS